MKKSSLTHSQKSSLHTSLPSSVTSGEPEPKIWVDRLSKSFGPKKVLQKLKCQVNAGESFVIIGGSGTGKSVFLKCILGLLTPDQGNLKIDGQDLLGASQAVFDQVRLKIGMLFQGSALFDSLKVWENIFFAPLQMKTITREEAEDLAAQKLAAVGLRREVAYLYPAELSGGMQRRVGLARAIAAQPEIVFFDEPTAGLDPIVGSVITSLIRDNVKKLGATAITITHDIPSARKIADRIGMLHEGHLIWEGPSDQLESSRNPYVDQFIHGRVEGPIQVEMTS